MMLTRHATARCQQLGIQTQIIDVLLKYGRAQYRHGAEVVFMDHKARVQAREELGAKQFAQISDRLDKYVVVSNDGSLITAAPRRRRMKF
jgi:hypothetical protein